MTSTLSIRLPAAQRQALKRRAAALQKTEASLLRELVDRETSKQTPALLVEKWAGVLQSKTGSTAPHPLKKQIHERNRRA